MSTSAGRSGRMSGRLAPLGAELTGARPHAPPRRMDILHDCIPAIERIDCDTLVADPEGPSTCRASVYQFIGSGADRCAE